MPKREQARIRGKMEAAYKEPTHKEAGNALNTLKPTLELINQSAASQSGRIEKHSSSRFGLPISCTAKDYFRNIIPCNGKSSLLFFSRRFVSNAARVTVRQSLFAIVSIGIGSEAATLGNEACFNNNSRDAV